MTWEFFLFLKCPQLNSTANNTQPVDPKEALNER